MSETEQPELARLTVELLSAYVANNTVASDALPALIESTRAALAGETTVKAEPEPEYTPAVSVEESLASRDHIVSLLDGKPYKALKRHLSNNGLTPEEYRARYNLPADYPLVAPSYSEQRRKFAKAAGLGGRAASPAAKVVPAKAKTAPKAAPAPKPAATAPSAPAAVESAAKPVAAKKSKPAAKTAKTPAAKTAKTPKEGKTKAVSKPATPAPAAAAPGNGTAPAASAPIAKEKAPAPAKTPGKTSAKAPATARRMARPKASEAVTAQSAPSAAAAPEPKGRKKLGIKFPSTEGETATTEPSKTAPKKPAAKKAPAKKADTAKAAGPVPGANSDGGSHRPVIAERGSN